VCGLLYIELATEARPIPWKFQLRRGTTAPRDGLVTEASRPGATYLYFIYSLFCTSAAN